ncbi:MAG: GNAT family N-acetyltransferase [Chloroflexi bacterium]|nr:GNAT family N-acetyltransferase [Chloroflexota bacterium]
MTTVADTALRDFTEADYERYIEIVNASYPDYGWTVEEIRHEDAGWDDTKHFRRRLLAEDEARVVGVADASHWRNRFQPDHYSVDVVVDPAHRRRGHGRALYCRIEGSLRARDGRLLRSGVKESMSDGVAFARANGFREIGRDWESRLDVAAFHETPFLGAYTRIAEQGITVTTFADERSRDGDGALHKAFELHEDTRRDVPAPDPATPGDPELFRRELEGPTALPDAYFIAVGPDGSWLGESNLWASLVDPTFLWHGITGVRREARGKGIAMVLKLETIRYAKAHAKREIKTWNATTNRPMLRINEAVGFVKQPAWIRFEKDLRARR